VMWICALKLFDFFFSILHRKTIEYYRANWRRFSYFCSR